MDEQRVRKTKRLSDVYQTFNGTAESKFGEKITI